MQDHPFLYTPDAEERQRWGFTKPSDHRVLVIPSGRHVGVYAVGVDAVDYFQREPRVTVDSPRGLHLRR